MNHTYTTKGIRRYRYYVCLDAQKRGRDVCPASSIPAIEIERFVIDRIRCIGRDPTLVTETERRVTEVREQILSLQGQFVDEGEVTASLARFDPVWDALSPRGQASVVKLIVERVDYDGAGGTVSITFRPTGIAALAKKYGSDLEEAGK